jgi:hypothetical protein
MEMIRPQKLAETVVFIDGFSGSGKSMIAPILSSFERGELWLLHDSVDYMCTLDHFGQIDRKAAAMMVQLQMDLDIYNLMIGRNTNFRAADDSGVASNLLSERYEKRLQDDDGDRVTRLIQESNPTLYTMTHWVFPMSTLLFQALGDRLKAFIVVVRHPFWLIRNWFQGRWEERLGQDPREFQLCYQKGGRVFPWYAYGWEEEYQDLSPFEKSIRTVASYIEGCENFRNQLSAQDLKKVQVIPFEPFAADPSRYLHILMDVLETQETPLTAQVMTKVRVPRVSPAGDFTGKKHEFYELMGNHSPGRKYRDLAEKLAREYEQRYLAVEGI